jgi:formylglycine-generating enzyme required for sulfatase activity
MKGTINDNFSEVFWMSYEHQAMHLETIMCMLIQSEGILSPLAISAPLEVNSSLSFEQSLQYVNQKQQFYTSEAGMVDMGVNRGLVWDNERPKRTVPVASFKVSHFNVTNVEYYDFWRLNEYQKDLMPAQWTLSDSSATLEDNIWIKTIHRKVSLNQAALWPVFVSFEQAEAYANWKKMRLLTEEECRKLMKDRQDQGHDNLMSNIGFKSWTPKPITFSESNMAPALVGDAWEWTSSVFQPHEGFEPGKLYPNYSKDFL